MNTYEALVIFKPILDVDTSDNALRAVENTVANLKGKILKKDKQGRKRLAYEIGKFKDGFVTSLIISLEADAVEGFKRACTLNEDILRFMIMRRDDYAEIEAAAAASAARSAERMRNENPRDRGDRDRGDRDRDRD